MILAIFHGKKDLKPNLPECTKYSFFLVQMVNLVNLVNLVQIGPNQTKCTNFMSLENAQICLHTLHANHLRARESQVVTKDVLFTQKYMIDSSILFSNYFVIFKTIIPSQKNYSGTMSSHTILKYRVKPNLSHTVC